MKGAAERVRIRLAPPPGFVFWSTVASHGWFDLAPFKTDLKARRIAVAIETLPGRVVRVGVAARARMLSITLEGPGPIHDRDRLRVRDALARMLRFEEDLGPFYDRTDREPRLAWVRSAGAGRLLRGATAYEDLVKLLLTTNCSWGLTRSMTGALVETLGPGNADTGRAFPTPEIMATRDERFYRDAVRAGYRSPYLVDLAARVASGDLDTERWRTGTLAEAELVREIGSVKGAGPYVVGTMLRLLGRYDRLALDSWCRAKWGRLRGRRNPADRAIERAYAPFGPWRGLALWMELTADWFSADSWNPT